MGPRLERNQARVVTMDVVEWLVGLYPEAVRHQSLFGSTPLHRACLNEKIPLEIIEVQTGSYLGEDDIVRFEDSYGRGS